MPVAKLSKRTVDAAMAQDRPYIIFDQDLKGFGLRVRENGSKSYVVEYRPAGSGRAGAKKRLTLGAANVLTAEEARRKAQEVLSKVRLGEDPLADRQQQRAAPTVADLANAFLSQHIETKRKASTGSNYAVIVRKAIIPALGGIKAADLTRQRVAKFHLDLAETPYQANRALAVIGAMFVWGEKHGLTQDGHNPARGIDRFKESKRERYLSMDELARLGAVLAEAETAGLPWQADETKPGAKHLPKPENRRVLIDPHAIAAIRLLIFTGARLREILHARWSDLDLERGALYLPDSKTGRKTVYLPGPAQSILATMPRVAGNPFIIPGAVDGAPRYDLKKPWAAICRAAGLEGLRIHDLRHTFASIGAGRALGLPIIGKLLGHTQAATTHRYAHLDADPLRRAVETIGTELDAAMNGAGAAESKEVVAFRHGGK